MEAFIPQIQARGSIIPNFIFANREISPGAKMLFTLLGSYARAKSYCYPSIKTLSSNLGVAVNTIKAWLNQLAQVGFIKIKHKENRILFYLFAPSKADMQVSKIDDQPSKIDTKVNINNLNILNNTPLTPHQIPPAKQRTRGRDYIELNRYFEKLWSIYPRKEAKESARKILYSLDRMGILPSMEEISFAIQSFYHTHAWQREHGRFIPQLTNFLRGKRWEDVEKKITPPKAPINPIAPIFQLHAQKNTSPIQSSPHEEITRAWKTFKEFFPISAKEEESLAYVIFSNNYSKNLHVNPNKKQECSLLEFLKRGLNEGRQKDKEKAH